MLGFPDGLSEIVAAAALRKERDTGPGEENADQLGAEVGRHAHELAQIHQLNLAMLRDGAAEIVVGSHRIDLDALIGCEFAKLLTACLRHINWVAVGTLAVDFDAL